MSKRNIFAIVFLVLGVLVFAGTSVYSMVLRHNADEIMVGVEPEEDETEKVGKYTSDVLIVEPEEMLEAAKSAGDALCEIQSAYSVSAQSVGELEGEALDAVLVEQKKLVADMKAYFTEGVSVPPIWYEGNYYDTKVRWEFADNYLFGTSSVDCLWLCLDESDHILAYAVGLFDGGQSLFYDFEIKTTGYGYSKMGVTLQNDKTAEQVYDNGVSEDYVEGIFDMIEGNTAAATKALTPEQEQDKADAYSAREELYREWLEENGGDD